jgi:hypothetical protein
VSVKKPCPPVEGDENSPLCKNFGGVSEKKMVTLAWRKIDIYMG